MGDHYLLVGGEVIPCSMMEWAGRFERHQDRVIAQDTVGGFFVSTVFLGLDHGFPPNPEAPLVFETMVFSAQESGDAMAEAVVDDWGALYTERYSTLAEAERGHARALAYVESGEAEAARAVRERQYNQDHHRLPE